MHACDLKLVTVVVVAVCMHAFELKLVPVVIVAVCVRVRAYVSACMCTSMYA